MPVLASRLFRLRATALAAVFAVALTAAPAGAAQLGLEHESTSVSEVSTPDGVIGPGDTIDIEETLLSSEPLPLTGLAGSIATFNVGVTLPVSESGYEDTVFGQTTTNLTPFRATLPPGLECGRNVSFAVQVSTGPDSATVPFTVGTGVPDTPLSYNSGDVPHVIPNPGVLLSSMEVADVGRVKDVRIRIGRIEHTYDQDLRISLISPAGTKVMLIENRGGEGDNFIDTVIASSGPSLSTGTAPFTGTFQADGDLKRFVGESSQGTWKLEIADNSQGEGGVLKAWGTDMRPATCEPGPVAVVSATPNPAGVGQTITFDASESIDPTGDIVKYEWDFDNDGTYELDTGLVPSATHSYGSRQQAIARVRVTNEFGVDAEGSTVVSVTEPPVAFFTHTPLAPVTGDQVTLDGSGSDDPDGLIEKYEWDLDGNGTFESDGEGSPTRQTSFTTPGEHTVRLRVTDDNGAQDVVVVVIDVGNRGPTASFTVPNPALAGVSAQLDGSASTDPDGTVDQYEWDLDGDGSFETDGGSEPTITHTYETPATLTVGLRVTDSNEAQATTTRSLHITAAPIAVLGATPNPARPNQTITFSGADSSDPDGTIVKYEWDLDGNGTYEVDTGSGDSTTGSYPTTGPHTVGLRVTDSDGGQATDTAAVDVVNISPNAVLIAAPNPAVAGAEVLLDATGSTDPDGSVANYAWDLDGNGSFEVDTGTTPATTRTYPNPGVITVRVRVTDNDGATAVATRTVTVTQPAAGGGGDGGGGGGDGGGGGLPGGPGTTPGTTPGETPGTAPGTGPEALPTGPFEASLAGATVQAIKRARRSGVALLCRADRAAVCTVKLEVPARDARKLRIASKNRKKAKLPLVVGNATVTVAGGADTPLVVKLSSRLRRALNKKKVRGVLVLARGVAVAADGTRVVMSRAVLLRK